MKEVSHKYCHNCGKKVNLGEFICDECYQKTKYHMLFNILGFTFGFCSPVYAIILLLVFKFPKTSFYKFVCYGIIISAVVLIAMFFSKLLMVG